MPLLLLAGSTVFAQDASPAARPAKYSVAAYVWPSCHDEPALRELIWPEGIGEWEMVKKTRPRFEGHYQPRLPLWGYEMDDDPLVMEKQIRAATDHGVNVFIYDWYWYECKPWLENALDNGFLKARNNDRMQFYLMWANHDMPLRLLNPYRYSTNSPEWKGEVGREEFKPLVDHVIRKYFNQPNYFKIDNQPVFSIYSVTDLVEGFGGLEQTRKALDYFRDEVKKAGLPGLHIQLIGGWGENLTPVLLRGRPAEGKTISGIVAALAIDSVTMYNMSGPSGLEDYLRWGEEAVVLREKWASELTVPFFPLVSAGWDNTTRFLDAGKECVIHVNDTPESFGAYLFKAKQYADSHPQQPPLILISAWNEWTEGAYIMPDMRHGYGYLDAVERVIRGEYDKYSR